MQIIWTRPALFDLRALQRYIARDNPDAASRQIELVALAVEKLRDFPQSGRPGRKSGTRELLIGKTPYLVPYVLQNDAIHVLRVLHGKQRWP